MPTYRGATHLRAAIDSVLAQTFVDFELVIIDDNSPDETRTIVAGYSDRRIRYLRNASNLGPQGNWNRCLDEARGTYFKLMPHDDLLASDCLARQIAVLEADRPQQVVLTFGAREVIDANGKKIMRRAAFGNTAKQIAGPDLIQACVHKGTNLVGEPGNVLMRRAQVEAIGAFDATYGFVVDLDYWFRALQAGDAYYLPESLSSFRISQGSWSVAIGARQYHEFRDFLRKYSAKPEYHIGRLDLARGVGMAWLNGWLRQWVYRWLLRRT